MVFGLWETSIRTEVVSADDPLTSFGVFYMYNYPSPRPKQLVRMIVDLIEL